MSESIRERFRSFYRSGPVVFARSDTLLVTVAIYYSSTEVTDLGSR